MKRTCMALLLVICLCTSLLPYSQASAGQMEQVIYSQNGIEAYYGVDSAWNGGFNAHIRIRNTSGASVEDWSVRFSSDSEITCIWNGIIESRDNGLYLVKNAGWNQDINPNNEISIGFTAKGNGSIPQNVRIISSEQEVKNGYDTAFSVNSDWNSGFSGVLTLTNTGDKEIEDWTLEFDFNRELDTVWNGVIVEHRDNHYVVKNAGYNQRIRPGQNVAIGMNGHPGNMNTGVMSNVTLRSFGFDGPAFVEGLVKIDTSAFIPDEDGVFFIPQDIYSVSGTVQNADKVTGLTYSTNNTFGLDLVSGELTIGESWTIEKLPLLLGYNELTVTAMYDDNTFSSDTVVIACMYEDRMEGLEAAAKDSDSDGLEDYIEAIYGTDPLNPDTDGDGLSDYTELAVLGTDPLKADSDGNGIPDGDEDYDKDGLKNTEEEKLGTLLYGIDSDYDELTDYDEVYVYFTDPLKADTDGDGASDGFEVKNGYDPLKADESFTVEEEIYVGGTQYELRITAGGENIESLEAVPVSNSDAKYGLISGYLDSAVDFKINGTFDKAELKVYFDESYLEIEGFEPALYYIDEENQEMVEIPGDWDGVSNYFYVELPHFSTYITLNKTEFIRVWENAIKAHAITENGETNLNIVFVTDLSGSMSGTKLSTMKNSINAFIDVLAPVDKAGLISFTSSSSVLSGLTSDKTFLKQKVNSMSASGLTSIYTGINSAVDMLEKNSKGGYNMIIVFTDGYDEPSTTYDRNYKSIVERAKADGYTIHTIGIGTIDSALLTRVANETGGSFYYAENASALRDQVTKVQEEIIDYTKDSNGDKIPDWLTKKLCDGELITWMHEPVIICADYDEIQNDLDGDFDNDGIINGEELVIVTDKDKIVSVRILSDMEDADTDGDSIKDGLEKNYGTNLNFKDLSESDYHRIVTNNGMYMAALTSEDYVNGTWLKFQLAVGNAVLRFKVSYVEDYKRALIDFINAYNQTTIQDNVARKVAEIYESDANEVIKNCVSLLSSVKDGAEAAGSVQVAELEKAVKKLASEQKKLKRLDWLKFKDTNAQYVTKRLEVTKAFGEVQDLEKSLKKNKINNFLVNLSPKAKKVLKGAGTVVSVGIYALDTADSIYNSCTAYGSLDAEFAQYDYIMDYLDYVKNHSEITELREAASQVASAIDSDLSRTIQTAMAILDNVKDTVNAVGVATAVTALTESLGPVVWAVDFGIALGNILAGTGNLDEETLKLIALGNSAETYAKRVDSTLVKDISSYTFYLVDDVDIQRLQLLAQLRIVGEDEAGNGYDKSGIVTKFIQSILYSSQAEYENDLRGKIEALEKVGQKLGFTVSGKFPNSYLY